MNLQGITTESFRKEFATEAIPAMSGTTSATMAANNRPLQLALSKISSNFVKTNATAQQTGYYFNIEGHRPVPFPAKAMT